MDNAWMFEASKTYTPAGDCDADVQTGARQPLPVTMPALSGDSASELSDEEAELHADVIDAARAIPSALTHDAGTQPPVIPRHRGRPGRAPPDCCAEAAIQTRIQLDAACKRNFNKQLV